MLVPIASVPDQTDIQWRILNPADGLSSTALASFYAPLVGCAELKKKTGPRFTMANIVLVRIPPSVVRCWAVTTTVTLVTLPASLGGLGLASAVRTAPTAYWAAWATHSLCLASAPRLWPRHASANWREGTPKRLASVVQRWHATPFELKAGRSARPGEQSRISAHQWRLTGASVTGRMAGSTERRALAAYTSASARCYQTCRPAPVRS